MEGRATGEVDGVRMPAALEKSAWLQDQRVEITGWLYVISGVGLLVLGVLALAALTTSFPWLLTKSIDERWTIAVACLVLGSLTLVMTRLQRRTRSPWFARGLVIGIALAGNLPLPSELFSHGIPQVIWLPVVLAAMLTDLKTLGLVAAFTVGHTALVHAHTAPFHKLDSVVVGAMMFSAIALFRWLQDQSFEAAIEHAKRASFLAYHDPLTELPNRRLLLDRVESARKHAQRTGKASALIVVDLNGFSKLNKALGPERGDEVLKRVGRLLSSAVRATDTVARVGNDVFAILLVSAENVVLAEWIASDIQRQLGEPVGVGGRELHVTASMGISMVLSDDSGADASLKRAEAALAQAKLDGENSYRFSSAGAGGEAELGFHLSQDMHRALEEDEFRVVYQPIVDPRTGRVCKAEALVRWDHPERGPISPGVFIPIAETNGLIRAIGLRVFEQAARQVARMRAHGVRGFEISVNRSAVEFRRDEGELDEALGLVEALGLEAGGLTMEITEGLLLEASEAVTEAVTKMREAGLKLSLDDFGTGYASIGYLHAFELDVLKIDRQFIRGLRRGSQDFVLVRTVINMAHSLGLEVVAEGVEEERERELLLELGCDFVQGYLTGRPMSARELEAQVLAELSSPGEVVSPAGLSA